AAGVGAAIGGGARRGGATRRVFEFFNARPGTRELADLSVESGLGDVERRLARLLACRGLPLVIGQQHEPQAEADHHYEQADRAHEREPLLVAGASHGIDTVRSVELDKPPGLLTSSLYV